MQKISVGYQALIDQLNLSALPHYRSSFIKTQGRLTNTHINHHEIHEYPKSYRPRNLDDPFTQLEFALKHDGINLEIISAFFNVTKKKKLCEWIQAQPTGKYRRITWFLYEWLRGETLDIPNCKKTKYIDVLDPEKYFTAKPIKSTRHRINNNLLGNPAFCPIIRRTSELQTLMDKQLDVKAREIVHQYDPSIIARANNYLLTKETMSSYEIEHERPNKKRMTKFINLLEKIDSIESLQKETLVECQNIIVDPRFKDFDYRVTQNYVGENINQYLQKIHYIAPKPEDLPSLMDGLLNALETLCQIDCHPIVIAAAISFGFVFLHPFEDGNGRLHRFLIHYILKKQDFTPTGVILPVSAIILQNLRSYDAILETFSKPLLEKIDDYLLDNDGVLTVKQETKTFYQYIDFTHLAEYLFSCIEETIELHFAKELNFLVNYDKTKHAIQTVVDMPDKLIDLLIRILIQNNGKLSLRKRAKFFDTLTDEELSDLIEIVQNNMINNTT